MALNLTTLTNLRQYLYQTGDQTTYDDTLLALYITQISGAILSYIQRPTPFKYTYTENRSGVGNQLMTLRNFPVLSVSSVTIAVTLSGGYGAYGNNTTSPGSTVSVPAASAFGNTGFSFISWDGTAAGNMSQLTLNGYTFFRGTNNVQIVYSAGYSVTNEQYTVTSSTSSGISQYTALQPLGNWGQDDGVFYSSGSSLTALSSGQQPSSAGQYLVTNGVYQFNVADAGQVLNVNYSYVPTDLEQACIQWVAERYAYRSRIGQKSASIGGQETSAYDLTPMPGYVALLLNSYKKWMPL